MHDNFMPSVSDEVQVDVCVCGSGILSVEELPASVHVLEDVYSYPWHIDTKYYTADVLLCTTNDRTIGDKSFAEAVQAFVVMFDSKQVWYIQLSVVYIICRLWLSLDKEICHQSFLFSVTMQRNVLL